MAKLEYKLHITGTITVETGLHIGGSEAELDIGGIDSSVIKIKQGKERIPYIPGSSLKGKLRSLLAKKFGYSDLRNDEGNVKFLFGKTGKPKNTPARLIFRDSYFIEPENDYEIENFLEDKAENVIDRSTGGANPRHLERVLRGSTFKIDIIMDILKSDNANELLNTLRLGFQLLQKDYLGGSGTRGYGQVSLSNLSVKKLDFQNNGDINKTDYEYDFSLDNETATA